MWRLEANIAYSFSGLSVCCRFPRSKIQVRNNESTIKSFQKLEKDKNKSAKNMLVLALRPSLTKYANYQQLKYSDKGQANVIWVGCLRFHTLTWLLQPVPVRCRLELIGSTIREWRLPPVCQWNMRLVTSVSSWLGPFPAALFLRGLEGWHAEVDLIVPCLSLNLHVRC